MTGPEPMRASVLVVDDDPTTRWMTETALADSYDVLSAASPAEALSCARRHPPDAIVVDLTLGNESGWELIGALQADSGLCAVPIVVLSARVEGSPPAGVKPCAAYLTKPCRMSQLRDTLGRFVVEAGVGARR